MVHDSTIAMGFVFLLAVGALWILYYDNTTPIATFKTEKTSEQILKNDTNIIQVSVIKFKDGNFTTLEYIKGHGIFGEGQYDTISGVLLNQTIKPMDIVSVNSVETLTQCKYFIKTKNGFVNENNTGIDGLLQHYNFTADSYLNCGDYTLNTFKVIKQ